MKLISYKKNESPALGLIIEEHIAGLEEIISRSALSGPLTMEEAIEWHEYRPGKLEELEKWHMLQSST
nr:hypothetical protein [Sinobaca sp. H24]